MSEQTPAQQAETLQDVIKFIELISQPCDNQFDHDWHKCKRCIAIHELDTLHSLGQRLLKAGAAALRAAVSPQAQEIERLKADQADWRKGVALIASALGDKDDNLSCVRIAHVALEQRAKLEAAEAELAQVRAAVSELPKCRTGMPHYCPNCDRSFDDIMASAVRAAVSGEGTKEEQDLGAVSATAVDAVSCSVPTKQLPHDGGEQ